jgi:acyl-CoA reductase-like NAD-dependent aldehyde dehydrogenase
MSVASSPPTASGLLVDGIWLDGSDRARREIRSPFDGELLATVRDATDADVDAAVSAAVRARIS